MPTVDEDLRTFLLTDAAVRRLSQSRVHQNYVPTGPNGSPQIPYIWFAKADDSDEVAMDDAAGTAAFTQVFDLECWGQSARQAAELKDAVRAKLNLARGTFGSGTVQGVFVTGQGGDYVPRGVGATGIGSGSHVEALLVEIKGHA